MTQNVESLVLDVFDWLEKVERLQKLLSLAIEQFDDSSNNEGCQIAEVLLERYVVGVEPCFDEISVLKSTILKHLSADSLTSEVRESLGLLNGGSR